MKALKQITYKQFKVPIFYPVKCCTHAFNGIVCLLFLPNTGYWLFCTLAPEKYPKRSFAQLAQYI